MSSLTLNEARLRAEQLSVQSYDVHLNLADPDTFGSKTRVSFSSSEQSGWQFIELAGAVTLKATLNDVELPVEMYADGRIRLDDLQPDNELIVEARLPYVSDGDGMHRFTDPADGQVYVSAYCGMDNASNVFACFDQPDLKATLTLSVRADPAWTVLANGAVTSDTDNTAGNWSFTRTPPIPPYLFVVCAGPWHSVRFEHAGLPFGWHARASLAAELERDAAELRRITTQCFDHYTSVFNEPYPFDSYDQIFVPGLNWGAMETAGCVTFRDEYLTRGAPTAVEQLWRSSVIAHEMAHMWFGDLVTMRWWEDSWLNESFADYMGYQVAGAAAGFEGAWVGWALERKPTAYIADARRSTHPVAEETEAMVDVDTAFGNFDMITYAKGNAVLRQLVTWLGEDDFLAGVNAYLSAHAFGSATLEDFLAALSSATDRDIRGWAQLWLRTTGFDTIRVERDAAVPVLHRNGSRPHRFHVAGYDDTGALVAERLVDLGADPVPLPEYAGLSVVPNSQDETYARLQLDPQSWRTVAAHLVDVADPLTRAMLWMSAVDRTRQGELPVAALIRLGSDHLSRETSPLIVETILGTLQDQVLHRWVAPGDLADARSALAGIARALLAGGQPDLALPSLRTLIATTAEVRELEGWLRRGATEQGVRVPADERWAVVRRLAELGHADDSLLEAEATHDPSATGQLGVLRARAARPDPDAKSGAWAALTASGTSNREYEALSNGIWSLGQADLLHEFVERYVVESPALASTHGQAFSNLIGHCFPFVALSLEHTQLLRERLAEALAGDLQPVLRRNWNDRLDDLDVALRVRRGRRTSR